jgi:NADPH-dependent 2,4-dienoyl-CoA reductase/sulfur reductase-like enzyme
LDPDTGPTGRVTGVRLADGRTVPADVVLVGVGVRPDVDWLVGSGLHIADGVRCDDIGVTDIPDVVAVGDCATWFEPSLGVHHRLEHWTAARERGAIAAAALLSRGADRRRGRPPYFWSDQYGVRIQMTGHSAGSDSVEIEEGSAATRDFLAVYRRGGEPVAALALGQGKSFVRWRRYFAGAAVAGISDPPVPVPLLSRQI